jgi:UDP-GlcNAc:undecaprenyl-phosphate GlcNAc-1-phosphate transferase
MWWTSAIGFLLAFSITMLVIPILVPLARKCGLVDHPGGRKQHDGPTPVIGGLAMVLGAAGAICLPAIALGVQRELIGFGGAVLLLLVVGLLDDRYDLSWPIRILAQIAATLVFAVGGGVKVQQIGPVFGLGPLQLGELSVPFTVFATVGLINAMNMIDGIDGLAGSLAFATLSMLAAAAVYAGNFVLVQGLITVLGAIAAFLIFNARSPWRRRASIFMGNAGSTILGLIIAWSSFRLTQNPLHPITPLLAPFLFAPPLIDCLVLIARRLVNGSSPFHADRNHLHHLLIDAGYTPQQIVGRLTLVSLLVGAAGALACKAHVPTPIMALTFLLMSVMYFLVTVSRPRAIILFERIRRA